MTADGDVPVPLPGSSAAILLVVGVRYEVAAFLVGCLVAFEAYLPGRWYVWGGAIVIVVVSLLVIGTRRTFAAYRKIRHEKEHGYTTVYGDAVADPALFFLDPRTLRVLAEPGQPRPRPRRDAARGAA
ncbi:MAG: hypothetical protein JWR66_1600 [Modestobacter sp.]|jgi:hypothetical protein|nr:hypothetical protein [Modestobacter sp.]